VTCGKQAPDTETNYTLISAQFGWRLTRYKRADGTLVLEWRCPNCWKEFKRSRNGATPSGVSAAAPNRQSSVPPLSETPPPPTRPGRTPR